MFIQIASIHKFVIFAIKPIIIIINHDHHQKGCLAEKYSNERQMGTKIYKSFESNMLYPPGTAHTSRSLTYYNVNCTSTAHTCKATHYHTSKQTMKMIITMKKLRPKPNKMAKKNIQLCTMLTPDSMMLLRKH